MLALGLRHNHFVALPDSFSPSEGSCATQWDRLPPALWKMQLLRQLPTVDIDRIDSTRTVGSGGGFSVDKARYTTAAASFTSYGSAEVRGTLQVDPGDRGTSSTETQPSPTSCQRSPWFKDLVSFWELTPFPTG